MATLRIALAGAGVIGRDHAARIRARTDCALAGIADPSPAAAAFAHELGVPRFDDLPQLLDATAPDGAILATPNALHLAGALACIARRMPVLVEKPVADTLADALQMAEAAEAHGVPVLVGHHRRHSAILEAAQQVLAAGQLGRLVTVHVSATFRKPDAYFSAAPWRTGPGGGPVLINLIHEIDSLRVLLGEIVELQAMTSNAARAQAVEDSAVVSLRFANGVLGSIVLSDAAAGPHSWQQTSGEDPLFDHHADADFCVIAGTRGVLQLPTMRLRHYTGEASWSQPLATERIALPTVDPLARQLDHFCRVIRGELPPRVSVRDAARSLQATLAVLEAATSRRSVSLTA